MTHLAARAALDRTSPETLPCLVRNLSPIGACVVFCADVTVPEYFDLFLGPDTRPYRAHLIWHDANTVGVSFLEARENAPEVLPDPVGSGADRPTA
ncbi:PilZ domain-containing protein [Methylobacterium sp. J-068]|uniref:PilZ domain-containing protein n=1 Tax=Methylobacterium sp. J-068 TaxID=2836649 RepID=UPI001FBA732C|nr:PilZ domain-containing protein [Methylobacterium sp. J-068]MCJ2036647.1 PilZ domain-containing protein [Methylobacterium sp. J-068]